MNPALANYAKRMDAKQVSPTDGSAKQVGGHAHRPGRFFPLDGKGNFTGIETVSGPRGLRLVVDKLSHAPLVSGFRRFNGAIEFATSRGGDRTYYASVIANDGAHKREHALVDDIEAVKIEEKWVLSQLQSLLILLGVTVPILRG